MITKELTLTNWADKYSDRVLKSWQIPFATHDDLKNGEYRRLFTKISDLKLAADQGLVYLCCDVLELDKDVVFTQDLFIFARRIEISNNSKIIIDRTENPRNVLLFTQEVYDLNKDTDSNLEFTSVELDSFSNAIENTFALKIPNNGETVGIDWENGTNPKVGTPESLGVDPTFLLDGEPLTMHLQTIFQIATLISADEVNLSIAQLKWIKSLSQVNPHLFDLSLEAGAMANNLLSQKIAGTDALLVPQLDNSIYASSAAAFMQLLQSRQARWDAIQGQKYEDANWANLVRDSLADKNDQVQLNEKLEAQANSSRLQAIAARDIAARMIVEEKATLSDCQVDFELGIKRWKEKETINAAFSLVMGVFDVLKELPAIIAGGPEFAAMPVMEAGLSIIAAGSKLISSETAETPNFGPKTKEESEAEELADKKLAKEKAARQEAGAKLQGSLVSAGEGAAKIINSAMKIADIAKNAAEMEASSRKILGAIGDSVATSFANVDVSGLDVVTGGSQEWDLLGAAIDDSFENLGGGIMKEIEGGRAYQLEFQKLIIKGKALSMARLAVAKANSQYAELVMRKLTAVKAAKRAEERLNQLKVQDQRNDVLLQFAFNKVIDAKRMVYFALEAYQRAFVYFTLADKAAVPVLPRITDSVDSFQLSVSKIAGKQLTDDVLTKAPSTMEKREIVIDDPEVIQKLKENNGVLVWDLKEDNPAFKGFYRIRFTSLEVFAEGLKYTKDISVKITCSGVYLDNTPRKTVAKFVGPPTFYNFIYFKKSDSDQYTTPFHGDISKRYIGDFFNPTPFTTWTFQFQSQNGDKLDFENVTSLRINFSGEASSLF